MRYNFDRVSVKLSCDNPCTLLTPGFLFAATHHEMGFSRNDTIRAANGSRPPPRGHSLVADPLYPLASPVHRLQAAIAKPAPAENHGPNSAFAKPLEAQFALVLHGGHGERLVIPKVPPVEAQCH